ncbi:MAG: hemolysin III family protein [Anaerolineae bacterium]|nr:hemolysin III family protein [Anaerolineae bacterium]
MLEKIFLEPVNTVTHLLATVLALPGVVWLLALTSGEPAKMVSLLVYGLSLIVLFGASTLLHGLKVAERWRVWLNRFDHMAIFLVIAGTYTPIVANLFPPRSRAPVLVAVWLIAGIGMLFKLVSARIHGFFNVSIYMILGWGGAVPLSLALQIVPVIGRSGLILLLLGGLIYSAGFVIYYLERPNPWPGWLGHHEIWHLFVIGGSLCHYLFMLYHVVPA